MTLEHERGQQLLLALNSLLRTVLIHDDANQQSIKCVGNFVNAVLALCKEGEEELTLQMSNGRFFAGEQKILHGSNSASLIQVMLGFFEKRQLAGFTFFREISGASPGDILSFARIVSQAGEQEKPTIWLAKNIDANGLSWVEVFEPAKAIVELEDDRGVEGEESDEKIRRDRARNTYSYGLSNIKEVARKLGAGQRAGISKSVRLVQNLVNLLNDDEPVVLGLSTLRIYDDDTYSHSVNVALLAMCIGKRIGLSRRALQTLGLCGLFHDLGKVSIPTTITKKPDKLTNQEWDVMQTHSLHSVRQIVMLRASHGRKAQLLQPAFEHHMKFDLSGYPKASSVSPSLFGRIITIADVFDAISSPRVYRKTSLSPDRALGYMMEKSGTDFDPILLKVFINMLGVYPPGTVIELDSDEIGLVVDTPSANNASGLPRALLLLPDGKNGYMKGATVNLAEKSVETGAYLRNIVNTVHPVAYNIQPAQYFF